MRKRPEPSPEDTCSTTSSSRTTPTTSAGWASPRETSPKEEPIDSWTPSSPGAMSERSISVWSRISMPGRITSPCRSSRRIPSKSLLRSSGSWLRLSWTDPGVQRLHHLLLQPPQVVGARVGRRQRVVLGDVLRVRVLGGPQLGPQDEPEVVHRAQPRQELL